jgi:pimeloyl-ACP methyl ester carboxylesterase
MTDFQLPETHYAQSGDVSIAYQVMGDGPIDLILVPGFISHIEYMHELTGFTACMRSLASFARVVTFDKRGQGLSDRMSGAPSLEVRMDDVRAIMDAISSKRAALVGFSEGGCMSVLFAATYPERVSHLVLIGCFSRSADRLASDAWEARLEEIVKDWGAGELIKRVAPSEAGKPAAVAQFAKFERLASSPGALRTILQLNRQIDVTAILPTLQVPTLVLHSNADLQVPVALGRKLASAIPGVKYIEYHARDHAFWTGEHEAMLGDIEEFITGHREHGAARELERVLATVLFTDIVGSTRSAAEMGDQRWIRLLGDHDKLALELVGRHRGNLVKSTGDGVVATFDGPGRAVRCALCARIWLGRKRDWAPGARRSSHRRDRDQGQGYRRHCGACGCTRHVAFGVQRGVSVARRHRPRGRSRAEVRRARFVRAQGPARPLGPVRGERLAIKIERTAIGTFQTCWGPPDDVRC